MRLYKYSAKGVSGIVGCISLLVAAAGTANASQQNPAQIHGFISQGYTWSSQNNFFGKSSDGGSFEHTEAAINISKQFNPHVFGAIQTSLRHAGNTDTLEDFDDAKIDFALLDISTDVGNNRSAGVRLGRIRNPIGLHNETRDAVFTRSGSFLPQPIYFDALGFRDLLLSSDGIQLYYQRDFAQSHYLNIQLQAARPRDQADGPKAEIVGQNDLSQLPGHLCGNIPMYFGRLGYSYNNDSFRAFYTGLKYKRDYEVESPRQAGSLDAGRVDIDMSILSAELNYELWSFSAEAALIDINRSSFANSPRPSHNAFSWYVRAQHRLTSDLSLSLRHDRYSYNKDDPSGANFPIRHLAYARDTSIAAQWQINKNWFYTAEAHYIEGTGWISALDNPNLYGRGSAADGPPGGHKYWTMLAMMLSYKF